VNCKPTKNVAFLKGWRLWRDHGVSGTIRLVVSRATGEVAVYRGRFR